MAIQKLRRNVPLTKKPSNSCGQHEVSEASVDQLAPDRQSEMALPESGRWDHFPVIANENALNTFSPYFSVVQWWLPEVEGSSIGRHEFVKCLGMGSYGQVYASLGEDGSLTAVKVMSKSKHLCAETIQAVTDECNLLSQMNHPNICALKGTINGVKNFYMLMEYAGSMTLYASLYKSGPLELRKAQHIFLAIMQGVDHMHSRGVAHCDLKPGNIVMSEAGSPKIVDFGFARQICEHTLIGPRGTFPFIAPEVLFKQGMAYDLLKADMWALGVVLLEMICGVDKVSRMLGWMQNATFSEGRLMQLVSFLDTPMALEVSIARDLGFVAPHFASILRSTMNCAPEQRLSTKATLMMILDTWM